MIPASASVEGMRLGIIRGKVNCAGVCYTNYKHPSCATISGVFLDRCFTEKITFKKQVIMVGLRKRAYHNHLLFLRGSGHARL